MVDDPAEPAYLSPSPLQSVIKQAEAALKQASSQPGYTIAILKVCLFLKVLQAEASWHDVPWLFNWHHACLCMGSRKPCDGVDAVFLQSFVQVVASDSPVEIRQAAAVTFKNTVKYRWVR